MSIGDKIKIGILVFCAVLALIPLILPTFCKMKDMEEMLARHEVLINLVVADELPDISQWHVRYERYVDLDEDGENDYLLRGIGLFPNKSIFCHRVKGINEDNLSYFVQGVAVYDMLNRRLDKSNLFLLDIIYQFDFSGRSKYERYYLDYTVERTWKRSAEDKMEPWLELGVFHHSDNPPFYRWEILKENGKLKATLDRVDRVK